MSSVPPSPRPWPRPEPPLLPPWNPEPERRRRRTLLRRLQVLLVAALVAFSLTTWVLVRQSSELAAGGPAAVVRAHLDALNRNDTETAWRFFSPGYRERIPYDDYQQLVVSHPDVFRTRGVEFREQMETPGRAVLVARLVAADGARYIARFTLVRNEGRWWIDDLRWSPDRDRRPVIRV